MTRALFFLTFFLTATTLQAAVTFEASVDKKRASLEDEIHLTLTLSGARDSSEPVLPSIPAFTIVSSGRSSSFNFFNGQISSSIRYNYTLIPQEPGEFVVPAISVFAQGVEYKTKPLTITVSDNQRQTPPPLVDPQQDKPSFKPFWIEAQVSKNKVYVSEQFLYTFRFYTSVNLASEANLSLPDFKDFRATEVVQEKKYRKTIEGKEYIVSEKVFALSALKSGSYQLERTMLRFAIPQKGARGRFNDPFFNFGRVKTENKVLRTQPLDIEVVPLPKPIPDNFSQLVGQFGLAQNIADSSFDYGDSTTLSIEIIGRGNIKDALLPETLRFEGFKIYKDQPQVETNLTPLGIQGKKIFRIALVPLKDGEFQFKPFQISYFNPLTKAYETLESEPFTLIVNPSEDAENLQLEKAIGDEKKVLPDQPSPLGPLAENLGYNEYYWPPNEKKVFVIFCIVPFILYWGLFFIYKRKQYTEKHSDQYRSQKAAKNFTKRLKKLTKAKGQNRLELLIEALRDYVGDRTQVYSKALTTQDMQSHLVQKGANHDHAHQLVQLISQLEAHVFGGLSDSKEESLWIEQASSIVKKIERSLV